MTPGMCFPQPHQVVLSILLDVNIDIRSDNGTQEHLRHESQAAFLHIVWFDDGNGVYEAEAFE